MELKGIQGNWRELEGTHGIWIYSREALVEVMKGKKLRKRGKEGKFHKSEEEEEKKRENIEALYERLNISHYKLPFFSFFALHK